MPAYNANATSLGKPNLQAMFPVEVITVDDAATTGFKSQQVALHRDPHRPSCFSVSAEFSGAPGTFAIDIQVADKDEDKYYVTHASISAVNSSNVGRKELVDVVGKFVRLVVTSLANAVTLSATIG